jgi:hypothetical protein
MTVNRCAERALGSFLAKLYTCIIKLHRGWVTNCIVFGGQWYEDKWFV